MNIYYVNATVAKNGTCSAHYPEGLLRRKMDAHIRAFKNYKDFRKSLALLREHYAGQYLIYSNTNYV